MDKIKGFNEAVSAEIVIKERRRVEEMLRLVVKHYLTQGDKQAAMDCITAVMREITKHLPQ